jgi:hypothetical protein
VSEPQAADKPVNSGNSSKRPRSSLIPITLTVIATGLIVLNLGNACQNLPEEPLGFMDTIRPGLSVVAMIRIGVGA